MTTSRSLVLMQMFDMGVSGVGPVKKLSEMTNVMPSADKGASADPSRQLFAAWACMRLALQL